MTLETKGKSKISAKEVIAARKLKVAHPEMSMQAIKDKLKLKIHTIMVGRALRGITHGHLDMCGLPVRPFQHRAEVKAAAKPGVKAAAKPAGKPKAKKVAKAKTEAAAAAELPRNSSGSQPAGAENSGFFFCTLFALQPRCACRLPPSCPFHSANSPGGNAARAWGLVNVRLVALRRNALARANNGWTGPPWVRRSEL
jgi:hypothetical protein